LDDLHAHHRVLKLLYSSLSPNLNDQLNKLLRFIDAPI